MSFKRRFRDVRRRSARRHENDVDAAGARHYILCAVSTPRAIRPGNNGWVCHAVVIDGTPLSTLKNRTCSVLIPAGCQAVSTFMISLSPSSMRHEPEYAIIVPVGSLSGRSLDVRIDIILSRSTTIWPSGLTRYVSAHSPVSSNSTCIRR